MRWGTTQTKLESQIVCYNMESLQKLIPMHLTLFICWKLQQFLNPLSLKNCWWAKYIMLPITLHLVCVPWALRLSYLVFLAVPPAHLYCWSHNGYHYVNKHNLNINPLVMGRNVTDHIIGCKRGMCHKEMASGLFALKCFFKNFTEGNGRNKIWGRLREGGKGRGTTKQMRAGTVQEWKKYTKVAQKEDKEQETLEVNWEEAKGRSRFPSKCKDLPSGMAGAEIAPSQGLKPSLVLTYFSRKGERRKAENIF